MDLLNLGSQSRKTGIKPKKNLQKDRYNMEDIDEFFEDDDESGTESRRKLSSGSGGGRRRHYDDDDDDNDDVNDDDYSDQRSRPRGLESGSYRDSAKEGETFNNFARKINFTDAETDRFDLSPISISKKQKKSPLRSPLPYNKKVKDSQDSSSKDTSNESIDDMDQQTNFNYDDGFYGDMDPDIPPIEESSTQLASPDDKPKAPPSRKRSSSNKKASSLTKNMALGKSSTPKTKSYARSESPPQEISMKPTPLPSPPPDGLRRSKRVRTSPLAFWRNERIVYSRANENDDDPDSTLVNDIRNIPLQEIKEIIHVPEPNRNKDPNSKRRSRLRTRTPKLKKSSPSSTKREETYDYESDPEVLGSEWFKDKKLNLDVYESQESEELISRTIAYAPDFDDFEPNKQDSNDSEISDSFKIARIFEDSDKVAGALIEFPHEGFKTSKSSGSCVYMFHVVKGLVEVSISNHTFAATRGCSFQVPSGNTYGMTNVGNGPARLFFVQTMIEPN